MNHHDQRAFAQTGVMNFHPARVGITVLDALLQIGISQRGNIEERQGREYAED